MWCLVPISLLFVLLWLQTRCKAIDELTLKSAISEADSHIPILPATKLALLQLVRHWCWHG